MLKFVFVAFNLLMLIWLVSYWVQVSSLHTGSQAQRTGAAIGTAMGTSMLFTIWGAGALVLGLFVLFT
ncbi:MAG: hypothetical protein ACRCTI_09515, partial [Beijerinckiaceae bacterium]